MKSTRTKQSPSGMREEYDFSQAVVGKYARRYEQGTNAVLLDPDVAQSFPDSKAVNDALRTLIRTAKSQSGRRVK